jgi:hypothetical protein
LSQKHTRFCDKMLLEILGTFFSLPRLSNPSSWREKLHAALLRAVRRLGAALKAEKRPAVFYVPHA